MTSSSSSAIPVDMLNRERTDSMQSYMSKYYGGKQAKLCSTTIWEAHGYLGPYSPKVFNVGDNQFMIFQPGDEGPFWMTADEHNSKREDSVEEDATTTRKLTKLELTNKLMEKGVMTKGKLSDLQQATMEQGIPIEEQL